MACRNCDPNYYTWTFYLDNGKLLLHEGEDNKICRRIRFLYNDPDLDDWQYTMMGKRKVGTND